MNLKKVGTTITTNPNRSIEVVYISPIINDFPILAVEKVNVIYENMITGQESTYTTEKAVWISETGQTIDNNGNTRNVLETSCNTSQPH